MTTIDEIDAHYARMEELPDLNLPSGRLPVDVMNPGTSRPENHRSAVGLPLVDQTRSVTISSNSARSSDGQEQRLDLSPLQGGVTVLEVPGMAPKTSNGQFQSRNFKPTDQGTRASNGVHLPASVDVASQNFHMPPIGTTTELPPARDVNAGDRKPGGLPTSVSIK